MRVFLVTPFGSFVVLYELLFPGQRFLTFGDVLLVSNNSQPFLFEEPVPILLTVWVIPFGIQYSTPLYIVHSICMCVCFFFLFFFSSFLSGAFSFRGIESQRQFTNFFKTCKSCRYIISWFLEEGRGVDPHGVTRRLFSRQDARPLAYPPKRSERGSNP